MGLVGALAVSDPKSIASSHANHLHFKVHDPQEILMQTDSVTNSGNFLFLLAKPNY